MNNQFCPTCQSPTTVAPSNLTFDFQSNMYSLQGRKQVSSPNLLMRLSRPQTSEKRFNFTTENQKRKGRASEHGNSQNVFMRGMSRADDKSVNSYYTATNGSEKKGKKAPRDRPRNVYETRPEQGRGKGSVANSGKEIRQFDDEDPRREVEFGSGTEKYKREHAEAEADPMQNTKQLTMGVSSPSFLNFKKHLGSMRTDDGREVKRRHTDQWGADTNHFEAEELRIVESEGGISKHNQGSRRLDTKGTEQWAKTGDSRQSGEIDKRVVDKFKKLKKKRKKQNMSETTSEASQSNKKLIAFGLKELRHTGGPSSPPKKDQNVPIKSPKNPKNSSPFISGG